VVAAIAVILFSTAGIARMMGWGPDSTGNSMAAVAVHAGLKCPECGVIVSMREIERPGANAGPGLAVGPASSYEIIVRMSDGTRREINHVNPANWRPGERVVIIDGVGPPVR
jgi:hypothetical protein